MFGVKRLQKPVPRGWPRNTAAAAAADAAAAAVVTAARKPRRDPTVYVKMNWRVRVNVRLCGREEEKR